MYLLMVHKATMTTMLSLGTWVMELALETQNLVALLIYNAGSDPASVGI